MKLHIYWIVFFYLIAAMLAMGWIDLLTPMKTLDQTAFWVSHAVIMVIWLGIGGAYDLFDIR